MERGVRACWNARGHRRQAQCRLERGAAAARYRGAPQAAQRRGAREYAGGVSRLRGGGNGEMGTRDARGQYQAGIADDVGLLLLRDDREQRETNVHGSECLAGRGAMRGEDLMGRSSIRNYATAASD